MNTAALILTVAAAAIAAICFAAAEIEKHRSREVRTSRDALREKYLHQIIRALASGGETAEKVKADTPRRRMALAEAMHTAMRHTYGSDRSALQDMVDRNSLDRFLLRRIRLARGSRRAYLLTLLSSIPSHRDMSALPTRYTRSRNRDVRISALTAVMAANPSMAVRTLAAYPYRLTPFDTARIIALLRRGLLPIAFEPLLANDNRNLRMLGMAIVRNFGIESADRSLDKIIASDPDPQTVREAIYTLASLGRPLGRATLRRRMADFTPVQRKELCRYLTLAGYSTRTIRTLLSEKEGLYAETLINSYKRDLVCK